jgi:hypothetical protein
LHGGCGVDVIEADVQYTAIESFHLAGHAVAVLHYQYIGFIPPEKRSDQKKESDQNESPLVHGSFSSHAIFNLRGWPERSKTNGGKLLFAVGPDERG